MSQGYFFDKFSQYFVCIYENNEIKGAGFLVHEKYILTCAHVVRDALGLEETPSSAPNVDHRIVFSFPFLEQDRFLDASIHADGWDQKKDIAVLRVHSALPQAAQAVKLSCINVNKIEDHSFTVYGYPSISYPFIKKGVWTHGTIGKKREHGLVQLESVNGNGYPVQKGFSGGPVFDKELNKVVGMIATADEEVRVSSMIPVEILYSVYSRVERIFLTEKDEDYDVKISPIEICQKCLQESFTARGKDELLALCMSELPDISRKLDTTQSIDFWFNQILGYSFDRNDYDGFWKIIEKGRKKQYDKFYPEWKKVYK